MTKREKVAFVRGSFSAATAILTTYEPLFTVYTGKFIGFQKMLCASNVLGAGQITKKYAVLSANLEFESSLAPKNSYFQVPFGTYWHPRYFKH